jgi:exonuclease SbcD
MDMIRILALADTHLGFDLPFRPRVKRRRRGPDFFDNLERALQPAIDGEVDLVVHGGDIFYRRKIPGKLVDMVFTRLHRVADQGIPIYLVPGNHERSEIPYRLLAEHPNVHSFDEPQTFVFRKGDQSVGLAGFPSERHNIRKKFSGLLEQTGWRRAGANYHILCFHQSVDGATTGPHNYTFRYSDDVIDVHDIPDEFTCVITGHMHRHQVILNDLQKKPLPFPIFYPGSIERTSFAEKDEKKGCLILDLPLEGESKGKISDWNFIELPARPMVSLCPDPGCSEPGELLSWIQRSVSRLPQDAIVRLDVSETPEHLLAGRITASTLRSMVPDTMNIGIRWRRSTVTKPRVSRLL